MNTIIENNYKSPTPEIGMGATELLHTDRVAWTIVKVVSENIIAVQPDIATRTDDNGMSDAQTYEYTPDPNAWRLALHRSPDGHWRRDVFILQRKSYPGAVFMLGARDAYHDYSS